jgi:hypothetical protein
VPQRREIGDRVSETAVALADDQWHRLAVRAACVVEEHAERAIADLGHPGTGEFVRQPGQPRVVEALADQVVVGEQHAQPVVHVVE